MANRFFNNVQDLLPITRARATAVEGNFDAVGSGFDLLQVEVNAALRAPDGETLARLPAAGARANKVVMFDGVGNTGIATVASQASMDAAAQAAIDAEAALASTQAVLASTQAVLVSTQGVQTATQAIYDTFRGRWLGALASDPSVDALGAAVGVGDLYFNTGSGRFKIHNGSTWIVGVDTQVVFSVVAGNVTASPGDRIAVDTAASRTITLPASPAANTEVSFKDANGNAHLMPFTIGRNSQTIEGVAEDMIVQVRYVAFTLKFINGSWRLL